MPSYPKALESYRQMAARTATKGQLVLMLYQGAISFLERALSGFNRQDDPLEFGMTINNNILRAQEIIRELNHALDMEEGGEFARRMRQLYDYFDNRLLYSNIHKEPQGIRDVIRLLTALCEAWSQMLQNGYESRPNAVVA